MPGAVRADFDAVSFRGSVVASFTGPISRAISRSICRAINFRGSVVASFTGPIVEAICRAICRAVDFRRPYFDPMHDAELPRSLVHRVPRRFDARGRVRRVLRLLRRAVR